MRRSDLPFRRWPAVPRRLAHAVALAVALVVVLAAVSPARAAAGNDDSYRLGPQDKVRVQVYEWRAAKGDVYAWTALNGEFTVGAGGDLFLPLIGQVPAAGRLPADVAATISARLKAKVGLREAPDAAVEVVQYRPFYIVGVVEHPGAFPYRPGLTVLQAVGIAGGLRRSTDPDLRQLGREIIAGQGDLMVDAVQIRGLLGQKARLTAELNGKDAITWPAELRDHASDPGTAQLMSQETLIFNTRRQALKTQLEALSQLQNFLSSEVGSISQQLALQDRQLGLIRTELKSVSSLREKGLVVAPRVLSLERTEAEAEGDRLRMNTALLQAKQEASKTALAMLELKNNRHNEIVTSLRNTQAKLDELTKRAGTSAALVQDTRQAVPQLLAERRSDRERQPIYTILHEEDGRIVTSSATEATSVAPGDTVKVELPPSHMGEGALTGLLSSQHQTATTALGSLVTASPGGGSAADVPQN